MANSSNAEELYSRRDHVLNTISSLQKYMVDSYIFEPNQCRLGYDSSPACNTYQLGQMVRFFRRTNTLKFDSMLHTTDQDLPSSRNILEILASLRACPDYQIDANHMHCGIRNKFLAALRTIVPEQQVGICGRCWREDSRKESWEKNPHDGEWRYMSHRTATAQSSSSLDGCSVHRNAKAMYTAESRDWRYQLPLPPETERHQRWHQSSRWSLQIAMLKTFFQPRHCDFIEDIIT